MPTPSARALGLPAVFALIELAGEFPAEVKKQELKRPPLKFADAKHRYAKLEQVIALLRGEDGALRDLRELFARIPKLSLPQRGGKAVFALHELFCSKNTFTITVGCMPGCAAKAGLTPSFCRTWAKFSPFWTPTAPNCPLFTFQRLILPSWGKSSAPSSKRRTVSNTHGPSICRRRGRNWIFPA